MNNVQEKWVDATGLHQSISPHTLTYACQLLEEFEEFLMTDDYNPRRTRHHEYAPKLLRQFADFIENETEVVNDS